RVLPSSGSDLVSTRTRPAAASAIAARSPATPPPTITKSNAPLAAIAVLSYQTHFHGRRHHTVDRGADAVAHLHGDDRGRRRRADRRAARRRPRPGAALRGLQPAGVAAGRAAAWPPARRRPAHPPAPPTATPAAGHRD